VIRVRTLVVLAAAGVLLAGCTPTTPDGPTVIPDPAIEAEIEPTSALESDPWVQAARAADLGYILAANGGDFSIAQYTSTRSERVAKLEFGAWKTSYVTNGGEPRMVPGPSVLLPIDVVEESDGATVRFCDASSDWFVSDGHPEADFDLAKGVVTEFRLTGDGLLDSRSPSTTACDATGAPVGRFDPVPQLPTSITEADVRPPLGSD